MQWNTWTIEGNQPAEGYGYCKALGLIISSLHESGKILPEEPPLKQYSIKKTELYKKAEQFAKADKLDQFNREAELNHLDPKSGWYGV